MDFSFFDGYGSGCTGTRGFLDLVGEDSVLDFPALSAESALLRLLDSGGEPPAFQLVDNSSLFPDEDLVAADFMLEMTFLAAAWVRVVSLLIATATEDLSSSPPLPLLVNLELSLDFEEDVVSVESTEAALFTTCPRPFEGGRRGTLALPPDSPSVLWPSVALAFFKATLKAGNESDCWTGFLEGVGSSLAAGLALAGGVGRGLLDEWEEGGGLFVVSWWS